MKIKKTYLEGCFVIEFKIFQDERGCFYESFNQNLFLEKTGIDTTFVQDNVSVSKLGVVRGLHMQKGKFAQAKLISVIKGKILDVVVDVRENSSTFGKSFSIELSDINRKQLFVPRGFLHGFSSLEENTIVSYKCDNYYNKESETGVIFNDKNLEIDWKLKNDKIIVSEKDKKLREFKTVNFFK